MNQNDKNVLAVRLRDAFCDVQTAVRNKHTCPELVLTEASRYRLLRKGKIPFRKGVNRCRIDADLDRVFDFSEFEREETVNEKSFRLEMRKWIKTNNAARDAILLGDVDRALKHIWELEKRTG